LQRIRGIATGILVGIPLALFVMFWLHGVLEVAILIGGCVGLSIALVVGTRSDAHDDAADAAWREVALDLPPASDRVILERLQARMPGPSKSRRPSVPPVAQSGAVPIRAAGETADPK
jgi:hypothetical protein